MTAKVNVDDARDEKSLLGKNQNKDFNNFNLTNIVSITLNSQAVSDTHVKAKAYLDRFHIYNERNRRDLRLNFHNDSSDLVKKIQNIKFNDNNLTNLDSVAVNRDPSSDNDLPTKKYIDNELDKNNTILRFNQSSKNFLKRSVVMIYTIVPNLIKYTLQIQRLLKMVIVEVTWYQNGL